MTSMKMNLVQSNLGNFSLVYEMGTEKYGKVLNFDLD